MKAYTSLHEDLNTDATQLLTTAGKCRNKAIQAVALDLLARREHSRREMFYKLQQRFDDTDLINEVLNKLVDAGWLDESRFAEAYIRSRAARGFGPVRIRQELLQRGIIDELIDEKLYNLSDINWQELAEQVRIKKFGEDGPKQYFERMKQLRFLHYRGFE